ncbi:MAG: HNH endonuclease [Ignavibacteriaceae bacterium]|nr:HNH endonuclease [Ignavibacteriaceae bacterium]HRN28025.1 HNH endonuclease [Ignavibacteriaceae bacterium]HRP93838.1 HNH endonuclease [Ignavibacteriaceae bacterium]
MEPNGKKKRTRIPRENKIRAELQKEIKSVCPFCDSTDVGHFEIHHIDENPSRNEINNLLLVCPTCHSKITKGDITLDQVINTKLNFMTNSENKSENQTLQIINLNAPVNKSIVGNNNKVTIKNYSKQPKQKYPPGCIGANINKANYVSYLITRYHEFKEYEIGKGNMNYAIFPSSLKKEFKIGKSRTLYHLTESKFEALVYRIQFRIDNTMLGRIKKSRSEKSYSTFEEYLNQ